MPKLTKSLPTYRHQEASGQAVVNLGGKLFYLGPHTTKASKAEYVDWSVVSQWPDVDGF